MGIRRLVDGMYGGRQYPRGGGSPAGKAEIPSPKWELDPKGNSPAIQDRNSGPADPGLNDVGKNWLRGYGSPHPYFDSSRHKK